MKNRYELTEQVRQLTRSSGFETEVRLSTAVPLQAPPQSNNTSPVEYSNREENAVNQLLRMRLQERAGHLASAAAWSRRLEEGMGAINGTFAKKLRMWCNIVQFNCGIPEHERFRVDLVRRGEELRAELLKSGEVLGFVTVSTNLALLKQTLAYLQKACADRLLSEADTIAAEGDKELIKHATQFAPDLARSVQHVIACYRVSFVTKLRWEKQAERLIKRVYETQDESNPRSRIETLRAAVSYELLLAGLTTGPTRIGRLESAADKLVQCVWLYESYTDPTDTPYTIFDLIGQTCWWAQETGQSIRCSELQALYARRYSAFPIVHSHARFAEYFPDMAHAIRRYGHEPLMEPRLAARAASLSGDPRIPGF